MILINNLLSFSTNEELAFSFKLDWKFSYSLSYTISSILLKILIMMSYFCLVSVPHAHTHTHIYIYIYIYILSSTDRLFHSIRTLQCGLTRRTLEAGIETHPTLRSTQSQTARPTSVSRWLRELLRYYVATAAAASVCLHFYTLSATRVLNSFEELCIMRAAAENSFARVLNLHGGASSHSFSNPRLRNQTALSKYILEP